MTDRKSPQRATEFGGPGENVPAPGSSTASKTQARGGEFPFDVLINRVIQEQHAEIRRELLRLSDLSARATNPELAAHGDIRAVGLQLSSLVTALAWHISEEEKIFPSLLKLELAYIGQGPAPSQRKLAREALRTISRDHDHYFKDLQEITRIADSIAAPGLASSIEHDLSARLKSLHRLLLAHCYFESNVVFARAAAMEAELFR